LSPSDTDTLSTCPLLKGNTLTTLLSLKLISPDSLSSSSILPYPALSMEMMCDRESVMQTGWFCGAASTGFELQEVSRYAEIMESDIRIKCFMISVLKTI